MSFQNLEFSVENQIGTLTIARPKALNALDLQTLTELEALLEQVSKQDDLRVLVLSGAGEKAFVAGADIKEMSQLTPLEAAAFAAWGQRILSRLESLGKPSIAAINGFALGGGLELALACTFRIAAITAKMGLPEITLGLIPGFGGTQRLPRLIGRGRALELILTGEMVDATRAAEIGLVHRVVEAQDLTESAQKLAAKLCRHSAATLALAESAVRRGSEMPFEAALAFEAAQFGVAVATEDSTEGMQAFVEKRRAEFCGR
jgi:enoyl-CoA hydratase